MNSRRLCLTLVVLMAAAALPFTAVPSFHPAAIAGTASPDYSPPPGALNPNVTQSNIGSTICVRGWTRTVRPPVQYTSNLKRQQMLERHLPGRPSDYEEDHYVPLEIGGHPTDPHNLWPQPRWGQQAAFKDELENALNRAVCGRAITLSAAQHCLLDQPWEACAHRMHTPVP